MSLNEVSPPCQAHPVFTYLIPSQTWTPKLPLGTSTLFFSRPFFQFIKISLNCCLSFHWAGCLPQLGVLWTFNTRILYFTGFNEHGPRTEPKGACSVSLSFLTPDNLPLQSPWFRYAFLHGPFIHLPHSESHFPGDLGCGVKAWISKQYVILPQQRIWLFISPLPLNSFLLLPCV